MVRAIVLVILGWLVFAPGQTQEGTDNIQRAEYLGRWVGDPRSFLERQGFTISLIGADSYLCVYGASDGGEFLKEANNCINKFIFTSGHESASLFCAKRGFTHYGIANLRISHSNVIIFGGEKYGHFMAIYGDIFCAIRKK